MITPAGKRMNDRFQLSRLPAGPPQQFFALILHPLAVGDVLKNHDRADNRLFVGTDRHRRLQHRRVQAVETLDFNHLLDRCFPETDRPRRPPFLRRRSAPRCAPTIP